jgi:hypothetical protein
VPLMAGSIKIKNPDIDISGDVTIGKPPNLVEHFVKNEGIHPRMIANFRFVELILRNLFMLQLGT